MTRYIWRHSGLGHEPLAPVSSQFPFFIWDGPEYGGYAQTINQHEIAAVLSSRIMRSIEKRHRGAVLQEKPIRRMAECMLIYGVLSRREPDQNAKQVAALISEISKDILFQISAGVSMDKFKKLSEEAHDLVIDMSKPQSKRSLHWLLRDCKSFINFDEIDEAVEELAFQATILDRS